MFVPGRDETDANRDQILDAAAKVFAEKGYSGTRMDDVVAEAHLSKGTVYWHYKSKDGLLNAVMRRFLSMELRRLDDVTAGGESMADGLTAFVRHAMATLRRMGPLMALMLELYAIALRKEWAKKILREYYAEFRVVLCRIVQEGIERGEFRRVDPEDTAIALTGLFEGIILIWVIDGKVVDLERHANTALHLLLDGLRRQPPV
jgi:AcrR family transcriptional regulator